LTVIRGTSVALPALFRPTPEAGKRFVEFFTANIRNANTRKAYARAAAEFAAWCEAAGLTELRDIEPVHVAAYVETLRQRLAAPSVKLHLAAIRMLFDWLVVGQVLAVNPASPVRGPKHVVRKGKTPVLAADEDPAARRPLDGCLSRPRFPANHTCASTPPREPLDCCVVAPPVPWQRSLRLRYSPPRRSVQRPQITTCPQFLCITCGQDRARGAAKRTKCAACIRSPTKRSPRRSSPVVRRCRAAWPRLLLPTARLHGLQP
jgi:hypothetical protein